ncbi:PorT family protein [Prevotella copri]|uniref:PorT family protein n=1 Tax=Segatella copri TaxID=165179 RepID=A0A6A7WD36_9BACT|nr:porin family protein [Segatella copri]MQP12389.1 PorT family protein [Segatella copri]
MKKLLVMAAMVLSSVGAFAQYSAGDITIQPKIGLSIASVGGDVDGDYKAGLVVGAEAEYHVSPLIGVSAGLLYSQQGCKWSVEDEDVDVKWKPAYLNIPILANFYVANGLALKAGVQPAFMVAKDDAKEVNTFDFSVPVGISYEYMNISLDARYNIGCTKVWKDVKGCNSVFQVTLGYKFKL